MRRRIDALRKELHALYQKNERTGSTVKRMEEISAEIAAIQEGKS